MQENQRTASQMNRLGLRQEAAKLAAERHQSALKQVCDSLAAIEIAVTER